MNQYTFKVASNQDIDRLKSIYISAIKTIGSTSYTAEQIAAWSSLPKDNILCIQWLKEAWTIIAVSSGQYIGFGSLQTSGRISYLYVAPLFMRQGVASFLLEQLITEAKNRQLNQLKTEASEFSKPLFEKFGFELQNLEYINHKNVNFTRYIMQKSI